MVLGLVFFLACLSVIVVELLLVVGGWITTRCQEQKAVEGSLCGVSEVDHESACKD